MEQITNDGSDAKRGRYHSELKTEVDIEEEFELELHQSGSLEDDLLGGIENVWEEDEEENVKVEIRNKRDIRGVYTAGTQRRTKNPMRSRGNREGGGRQTDDEKRSRLKRPFEGHVANYEQETDQAVIARRNKQIEYGKNTPEYFNYLQAVPRESRESCHPRTPNKYRKYSRRAWDGCVKQWRINLHCWSDYPVSANDQLAANESDIEKLNESFTSEASGSTSTTSSVAAAFSRDLGFLNAASLNKKKFDSSRSTSESESECMNAGNQSRSLDTTVIEKKGLRINEIKGEAETEKTLSTSWADEVEDYYDFENGNNSNLP